ncbi:HNH endonuclease [Psychromonas aquimarina]|uniref:HNH endonuclease n=1 Tax=Psychromonas aquimarina TaxID=444919 RepID=UPI00040D4897|nr:HNH endonuclease signature motif containing protein [Psychromonas aquimarina]
MDMYHKVLSVCREEKITTFTGKRIKDLVQEKFSEKKRNNITCSDYCYNFLNDGISFEKHIFIRTGHSEYEFVGEDHPFTGDIFHVPNNKWSDRKIVGLWKEGKFNLFDWDKYPEISKRNEKIDTSIKPNGNDDGDKYDSPIDEKTLASILSRRGQKSFRERLLREYSNKCAVTGCNVQEALEAAHIVPHSEQQSYDVRHGLLLRADIHTLFDLHLFSINPQTGTLAVSPKCKGHYEKYDGKTIHLPENISNAPAPELLMVHYKRWLNKHIG